MLYCKNNSTSAISIFRPYFGWQIQWRPEIWVPMNPGSVTRLVLYFYTDSQRESLYIVFPLHFSNLDYFSVCSFYLSAFLSAFLFFVCFRTFLDPWLKKSINQLFTGAGTLNSLILELEKFWRKFWKSHN